MIELDPIVLCPFCRGTKQDYSIKHKRLVTCTWCGGKGWCSPFVCKGCGKPANKFWPPRQMPIIRYCGMETCFSQLVKIHPRPVPRLVQVVDAIDKANRRRDPKEELEDMKRRLML